MPGPEGGAARAAALLLPGSLLGLVLLGCGATVAERPAAVPAGPVTSAAPPASSGPAAPQRPAAPEQPAAAPARLVVPSLGLDESLVGLGLTGQQELEVPSDPDRVGWFTGGGRPGGPGPTVLVGHVDSTEGPAVFARLPELAPGDEVVVLTADRRHRYVVTETADLPQDDFPTAAVFGATPADVLRLITCTGPYDQERGRYTENRVVTAVRR